MEGQYPTHLYLKDAGPDAPTPFVCTSFYLVREIEGEKDGQKTWGYAIESGTFDPIERHNLPSEPRPIEDKTELDNHMKRHFKEWEAAGYRYISPDAYSGLPPSWREKMGI
jgi:hypothetical protein